MDEAIDRRETHLAIEEPLADELIGIGRHAFVPWILDLRLVADRCAECLQGEESPVHELAQAA